LEERTIDKFDLKIIETKSVDPYYNLALEWQLLKNLECGEVILYLWQNEKTVVIGKNQNAYAQCNVELLKKNGGLVARRPSGGGAVYHDLGNLNFSFLARGELYDTGRQLGIIADTVCSLGIDARITGRNDVETDGKKFSGNAFYRIGDRRCHHGTVMVDTDKEAVARYLNVSAQKLKSKGIDSVKSRVCCLGDLKPGVDVKQVKDAIAVQFANHYNAEPQLVDETRTNGGEIAKRAELYGSWDWLFGNRISFTNEFETRFDWGEVNLVLDVRHGVIQSAQLYTDALDADFGRDICAALISKRYGADSITQAISEIEAHDEDMKRMNRDIADYISGAMG